jgi:glutamyl-tRNA synthetase
MLELVSVIEGNEAFSAESLSVTIKDWITFKEIGFGKVMMPLRLALVGALKGPDVFDIMFMIGRGETIKRIEIAIESF